MFSSRLLFPRTSSMEYPMMARKLSLTSTYRPSSSRLMFTASGLMRNAERNFSSLWMRFSLALVCSVTSLHRTSRARFLSKKVS